MRAVFDIFFTGIRGENYLTEAKGCMAEADLKPEIGLFPDAINSVMID